MTNGISATARMLTSWNDVMNAARCTMGGSDRASCPSEVWQRRMLMCRHSPIEALVFEVTLDNLPYWVSVHLVRHHVGVTHYVKSQRTDRTGVERAGLRQDAPVTHRMVLNAQALLAISRRRLCASASRETRDAWRAVREAVRAVSPTVAEFMQPDCWWMGGYCAEFRPCGARPSKTMPMKDADYE